MIMCLIYSAVVYVRNFEIVFAGGDKYRMMRTGNNSSLDPGFDFSILDMIKAGGDNRILDKYNNPFNPLSSCDAHSLCLILPAMALINVSEIKKMLGNFYIHEIFELGTCYLGHNEEPYFFWFISKDPVETIKVSIFYKDSHPEEDSSRVGSTLKLPSSYTNSFLEYISLLDNWHKGFTKMPASEEHKYEFNEINAEEFEPTRAYARYYRKENDDIRKLLSKTTIVPIEEVADVITSRLKLPNHEKKTVRIINNRRAPNYPFSFEKDTIPSPQTTEKLHKNDIVAYRNPLDCFLLDFEPDNDLYALGTVIRARKTTPEYLYLYLKSKTAQKIYEELTIPLGFGHTTLWGSSINPTIHKSDSFIEQFPVVLPQKPDDYDIEKFQEFSTPNEHHYLKQSTIPPVTMEDVLSRETINDIRFHNSSLIRKQVLEDIEELNICFSNKAYKATLILCGSILEAVLIDWLSEINGVNYFKKNKITVKRAKKDKNGQSVVDSEGNPVFERVTIQHLDQYINTIKEIKDPDWDAEADCADQIREKRNLVHAKACLKQDARITESTCEQVIEHLKTVLRSRGLQK